VPAASDFLLIRLPCGALQLREISGCVSVGQQHPMRPVWAPGSEEAKDFELQRLVVGIDGGGRYQQMVQGVIHAI
jgi:hypothetical protein